MTFDFDPIFTLQFNTETIRPMSAKIIEKKPTGYMIIILLLTIFDGIMGCRRNELSEQWAVRIMGRRSNGLSE